MNEVSFSDIAFMSLALADFTAAGVAANAHDYGAAGSLVAIGIILVYLYHRFGSRTIPPQ